MDYFRRGEPYTGAFLNPAAVLAQTDVSTTAVVNFTVHTDVTTTAIVTTTNGVQVSTSAVLSQPGIASVDTTAIISGTAHKDVTTDADVSNERHKDVTTTAVTALDVHTDVSTSGVVTRTLQTDVTTDADIITPAVQCYPSLVRPIYFLAGKHFPSDDYEIWKYSGSGAPTLVYSLVGNFTGGFTSMVASTVTGNIYINEVFFDPTDEWPNGHNAIWKLNPQNDTVTHLLDYNYVSGESVVMPAITAYEDNGRIYFSHTSYSIAGLHLVRYNPTLNTIELSFPPYMPGVYYHPPQPFYEAFTDDGPGFIVRVGSNLYYANGSELFVSLNGNSGTWALVDSAGVYQTPASYVFRSNLDIGLWCGGTFDAAGNYYFAATNDTAGGGLFGPDNLWNPSIFRIGIDGTVSLVFQDTNALHHFNQPSNVASVVIDNNIKLYAVAETGPGVQPALYGDIGAGWQFIEYIPNNVYNSNVNNGVMDGPQGLLGIGDTLFVLLYYTNDDDNGVQLIARQADGSWCYVTRFSGYEAFASSRGQMFVMVETPVQIVPPPINTPLCTVLVRSWVTLADTTGRIIAIFDDWKNVQLTHIVNSYSVLTFSIDGLDDRVSLFGLDCIIELWRQVGDVSYVEYTGFHRVSQNELTQDQHSVFTSISRGLLDLVHRRYVYYQAVTAFTLKSAPGETVIKEIVNENVGPGATTPPRFLSGVTTGLTIQTDFAQGLVWAGQIANDNVLDIINSIATLSSVDYDIIRTGPVTFEFRTYYPQRGVDLSASLAFSPDLGNMVGPVFTVSNDNEVNTIVVFGTGTNSSRRVAPFAGTDTTASPWNVVEGTVDASDQDTYEGMQTAGETYLKDNQPKETFEFDVLQADYALYGVDYRVGDLITARFNQISRTKKIVGADITIKEGQETIKLTFSDLPAPT